MPEIPQDRRYPSDLSDAERRLLEPLLAPPRRRGRPPKWPRRLLADAVPHVVRTGCPWRMLPHDFPPWRTVHAHFRRRWRDGALRAAHARLRERVRLAEGRAAEPAGAVVDSRSVRTAGCGGPARGHDGAKRLNGRKRHLPVGTAGRGSCRSPASTVPTWPTGTARACWSGRRGRASCPGSSWCGPTWATPARSRVGSGPNGDGPWRWCATPTASSGATYGLEERPRGFRVLPRRWVVERAFAWLGRSRRLSKDRERLPATSEAMIHAAMSRIMLRRLTKPAA